MTKRENIDDPNSCWNKAADDEILFILRDKDLTFIPVLLFWVHMRIFMDIDLATSPKLTGALEIVDKVREKRRKVIKEKKCPPDSSPPRP